jgi:xanthine dehydrogenase YagS FAD-binding subunit
MAGENRYHSIFGAVNACLAVNPSDTAPALVTLKAKIVTNKRTIEAEQFWGASTPASTVLEQDEIVTEVQVPAFQGKSAFIKYALRRSIDFPIVNCSAAITEEEPRICLNAVHNLPYRATKAENVLKGKTIDESVAEAAGTAAVEGAQALPLMKWKVQVAKTMVKRAVLACQ